MQLTEYRLPESDGTSFDDAAYYTTDGIAFSFYIYFRVAFKPVATVLMEQPTVDIYGNETILKARGRHDPCVLPRAVPIVEAMAAMTILDYYLLNKTTHL